MEVPNTFRIEFTVSPASCTSVMQYMLQHPDPNITFVNIICGSSTRYLLEKESFIYPIEAVELAEEIPKYLPRGIKILRTRIMSRDLCDNVQNMNYYEYTIIIDLYYSKSKDYRILRAILLSHRANLCINFNQPDKPIAILRKYDTTKDQMHNLYNELVKKLYREGYSINHTSFEKCSHDDNISMDRERMFGFSRIA